jgi:hypothetical protein
MNTPEDLITINRAREILGVSTAKIANLVKESALTVYPNPLDKRSKLVSHAEVIALIPKRLEAA